MDIRTTCHTSTQTQHDNTKRNVLLRFQGSESEVERPQFDISAPIMVLMSYDIEK